MRSGPNDTGPLKHPDQFRAEMNEARRQALNTSSTFATPIPDPSRHLALDSEPSLSKRVSKPNPRYASMVLAEVSLDAELEGYQYCSDVTGGLTACHHLARTQLLSTWLITHPSSCLPGNVSQGQV
ncbi:hypothetical protein DYB38_007243 [Aphanomyces astaci]|uniref:Uncharacterized protein n=1 Tax=Aphanomyces astaci TaxID=112090 RepID=A0A397C8Q1_APHAT|nr:hypothetical protein DYB38_007243 [Aphanomyces astaci]